MRSLGLAVCATVLASCLLLKAQDKTPPVHTAAGDDAAASGSIGNTQTTSYIIGPADILTITVWKEPTLSGNVLVRPDGMISMPLIAEVHAAGLTPLQLSADISEQLKKFVQSPLVSVVVSEIHSKTVNLLGEVAKKGPVELTSGMTILDAIGAAGGLTDFANQKKIYILRDHNGTRLRIPVHYKKALRGAADSDLVLQPGDTIVVP